MSADIHSSAGDRFGPGNASPTGTEGSRGGSPGADPPPRASQWIDEAKDTAQSRLNEKKDAAAEGLHSVAGALRGAAGSGSGDDPLLGLTASAADGLDRLSGALRNKDVGVMMRDMESFARAQPVAFFGLALAAGFLAVRYLKASQT